MGDLATVNQAEQALLRSWTSAERAAKRAELAANVESLSDDDLALLLELEQLSDYEKVDRLPKATLVHHIAKPAIDLGGQMVRELEAVILYHATRRGLWEQGESGAPKCSSQDGIAPLQEVAISTTRGDLWTGITCAKCEFNKWGSAGLLDLQDADSNSKACKEQRLLLLLARGRDVPVLLFVPPTSLKPWGQYLADMAFAKRPLIRFYTKFSVEKTSSGGFDYGALRLEFGDPIDGQDLRRMFVLKREYEASVQQVQAVAEGEGGTYTEPPDEGDVPPPSEEFAPAEPGHPF